MDVIKQFKDKVRGRGLKVVLPEGSDPRIVEAGRKLKDDRLAEPVLLGKKDRIAAAADEAGVKLDGIETIDPRQSDKVESYSEQYREGRDDVSEGVSRRMVSKNLFYGGMMVASGDAAAMVAGVANATATLIQAGVLTVGLSQGIKTASSYFLMVVPQFDGSKDRCFIYADCAVNIDPNAEQLADIALASAQSAAELLQDEPRVAMLSYSTRGSASGESVEKVNAALSLARQREPKLAIDGEFQADTAIIERVAAKKVKGHSDVAGRANVLIFPDLDAGNIAYKLTQYMAGAQAIGPFLQGFARPVTDLSRGATVADIIATAAITLAQVQIV